MTDSLTLMPIIDASLRRQAVGTAVRNGHRLGRFRRDARKLLRASCAICRERIVVDEGQGLISGAMMVLPCRHRAG